MSLKLEGCPRCGGDLADSQCIQCSHEVSVDIRDILWERRLEFVSIIFAPTDELFKKRYSKFTGRLSRRDG
jgi:hypothetical protein